MFSEARDLLREIIQAPIDEPSPKAARIDDENDPWVASFVLLGRRLGKLPRRRAIEMRMEFERLVTYAELDMLSDKENDPSTGIQ